MPKNTSLTPDTPPALQTLSRGLLDAAIADHLRLAAPRLERFWRYYRNPASPLTHTLAQAEGLPDRLQPTDDDSPARETVIENDIAWRIHALADFMFAAPPIVRSRAADADLASAIDGLLRQAFLDAGGAVFFQNLAVLGSVFGHVDILAQPADTPSGVALSVIDARRGIALTDPADYRRVTAYILRHRHLKPDAAAPGLLARVATQFTGHDPTPRRDSVTRTHIWTDRAHEQLVETRSAVGLRRDRVSASVNPLGRVPVIHIQNLAQPFHYSGLSDVEPLIPLQDELNTRLSDRANRLAFQAFKMYLGVGIEGFGTQPVGPGQLWSTDNPDARILEFGGDHDTPSEAAHITEVREALDKASAVSPIAAGIIRGRVGNLTSENALRIVLMGMLAKTRKKRMTYGEGLERLAELILHSADQQGTLRTAPADRRVRIDWPDPLPLGETQTLANARLKRQIGVDQDRVLAELGYDTQA